MSYIDQEGVRQRTPAFKLFLTGAVALCLIIPLFMVYALVYDRQGQSETAQNSISAGWGGQQSIIGPVLVIPYAEDSVERVNQDGKITSRTVTVIKELFLSPENHDLNTIISPRLKTRSIYESILYEAENKGVASFNLPEDFKRYGIEANKLKLDNIELRFGVSDARGLQSESSVNINGKLLKLKPGKGLRATNNSGFFTFVDWDGTSQLDVKYNYKIRGNKSLQLIPRGVETNWNVTSTWPHPSFTGDFLPTNSSVKNSGFTSSHNISNLALGQSILLKKDPGPSLRNGNDTSYKRDAESNTSQSAIISMVEPVNLYSQVDRATKYGFMFIGFTFLAFLMFDIVGGIKVSAAEYLLTGAGLILFFVMLLAFAEVIGFVLAYLLAGSAITGLLTSYSAAVLKSWKRAGAIAALLIGLYGALFTLLNLEGFSLLIGSVMLFIALAVLMWTTRAVNWSSVAGINKVDEPHDSKKERPIANAT